MCLFSCLLDRRRMPKTGLMVSEWKQRLRAFALGEYLFGRGQKPPKNSHWAREIVKIETCPLFSSQSARGPCTCGYHVTVSSACFWCSCEESTITGYIAQLVPGSFLELVPGSFLELVQAPDRNTGRVSVLIISTRMLDIGRRKLDISTWVAIRM